MDITNPNSAQPSVAIPSVMPEEASTDGLSAWADIDLSAISDNVAQLGRLAGDADVMAVIKGDAYGHGLAPVAGAGTYSADLDFLHRIARKVETIGGDLGSVNEVIDAEVQARFSPRARRGVRPRPAPHAGWRRP